MNFTTIGMETWISDGSAEWAMVNWGRLYRLRVGAQMPKNMENIFGIGVQFARDFFGRLARKTGNVFDARLQFENAGRCFFPGFDARLMIGVDIDQAGVKADRPF